MACAVYTESREHPGGIGRRRSPYIEDGIRTKLRTERTRSAFRLRDAAVKGSGLQPEFRDAGWPAVRNAIYEGRGA